MPAPPAIEEQSISDRRRFLFALVTITLSTFALYLQVMPTFGEALEKYFAINHKQYGLLFSVPLIPMAIAVIVAGLIMDRRGARVILCWGLVGCAVGMALIGVGKDWRVMTVALVVASCFQQAMVPAVQVYLARLFPSRCRRMISLYMAMSAMVHVVAPLMAGGFIWAAETYDSVSFGHVLHLPFVAVAVLLLAGSTLYTRRNARTGDGLSAGPEPDDQAGAPGGEGHPPQEQPIVSRPLLNTSTVLLLLMLLVHSMCDWGSYSWMALVLDKTSPAPGTLIRPEALLSVKGLSYCVNWFASHPRLVLVGYGVVYVISRSLLAAMPERFGRRTMMLLPGLLGGGAFLTGLLCRSHTAMVIGYILGAALWSVEFPVIIAILAERYASSFGRLIAINHLALGAASFVVVNTMGWLGEALGDERLWMILLIPAIGFPFVSLFGFLWLLNERRQKRAAAVEG